MKGELDISDALLERAIAMYDANAVSYVSLDMCTKKENALLGVKKDRRWEHIPNAYGKLELRLVDDDTRLSVDTQFAFIFALQRRALALQMGDVMEFSLSEKLRAKLIEVLMKPAPTGFLPVGMNQVLEADFVFWTQMVEETTEGIKRKPNGRPCDNAFNTVFTSCEFRMALMNRQAGGGRSQGGQASSSHLPVMSTPVDTEAAKSKKQKKREAAERRATGTPPNPVRPVSPKPVVTRQMKAPRIALPKPLVGMCATPAAATGAKSFCFAYNMNGCKEAAPGKSCGRGFHGCMKPLPYGEACSGSHTSSACTR